MSRGNPPDCWSLPSDNKWKCPLASSRWPVVPEKPVLYLFPFWLSANGRKRNNCVLEQAECRLSSGSVVPAVASGWRKSLGCEFAFYFQWNHLKAWLCDVHTKLMKWSVLLTREEADETLCVTSFILLCIQIWKLFIYEREFGFSQIIQESL